MRNFIRGAQWHLVITGNLREDLVAEDIEGWGDSGADLTWGEPAVGVSRGGRQSPGHCRGWLDGRAVATSDWPARDQTGIKNPSDVCHVGDLTVRPGTRIVARPRMQRGFDEQATDLEISGRGDEHRSGVDAFVEDPLGMQGCHRVGDFMGNPCRLQRREGPGLQQFLDRLSRGVFADNP